METDGRRLRHAHQTFIVHQLWGVVLAFLLAKYGREAIMGERS